MLKQSKNSVLKKTALAGAAIALALGAGAPAFAGGSSYVNVGYSSGYYGGHGYYGHHRYRGGHHYRGHRRHGHHGGGGKAAAIALGVIGGAIILNEVAESRERDRYYEARERRRYYEDRRVYDDRYDDGFAEGYERGRAAAEQGGYDDSGLDGAAIGGELEGGPEPIRLTYARAYDACLSHARAALSERGFVLSAPYKPETAEENGPGWKMTATVSAERGSDAWSRAMYCEADESRVYRLELI